MTWAEIWNVVSTGVAVAAIGVALIMLSRGARRQQQIERFLELHRAEHERELAAKIHNVKAAVRGIPPAPGGS